MNQGGDGNSNQNQLNSSSIEESVIIHDTNSWKVRPSIVTKDAQSGDDLLSGDMALRREENDLHQIYKVADFVNNNLSNSTKQWLKAKYQLMCTQSLLGELQAQGGADPAAPSEGARGGQQVLGISSEKAKLLADMLKPIN